MAGAAARGHGLRLWVRRLFDIEWPPTLALALLLIVVPIGSYAVVAGWMGLLEPRLNYDFFSLYVFVALLARDHRGLALAVAVAGVILILAIQLLVGLGMIYLDNPALIVEYISFIAYWPWRLIGFWMLVAAGVFTVFALVLRRVPVERAAIPPVIAAVAILFAMDAIGESPQGQALVGGNWATSSAGRGYWFARQVTVDPNFTSRPFGEPQMVDELMAGETPSRILSIAVEALGIARADPSFNEAMFAPLRNEVNGAYDMEIGVHSFRGMTLAGELRELCGLEIVGTPTQAQAAALSRACLPARLSAAGYATFGLHGNARHFYNRSLIYPALGFERTKFYEDYARSGKAFETCDYQAFQGVCDSQIFGDALAFLANRPRAFVHVMTLDTHFPLGPSALGNERCGRVKGLNDSALCLYVNQMATYLGNVGRQIRRSRNPPDKVIFFGDHAPPFVTGRARNFFSRQKVPVIVLTRRAD